MKNYLDFLNNEVDDGQTFIIKLLITIAFTVIVVLIRKISTSFIERAANEEVVTRRFSKISRLLSIGLILLGIFYMWFNSFRGVGILLWVFIIILGLALKDVLLYIIYYFYVIFTQPFKVEDIIEIDGHVGIVESIDFMEVHLQELAGILDTNNPTGRIVTIPNKILMEEVLINYTRDTQFVMEDVYMLIDFDADREKAIRLAGQYIYEFYENLRDNYINDGEEDVDFKIFNREMEYIDQGNKPNIWQTYDSNGIRIYVRFFTTVDQMGSHKSMIELGLYDLFKSNGITMPRAKYINIEN